MELDLVLYWALVGWYALSFRSGSGSFSGPYIQKPSASGPYMLSGPYMQASAMPTIVKYFYIAFSVGTAVFGGILYNSYFPIDPGAGSLGLQVAVSGVGAWLGAFVGQDLFAWASKLTGTGSDLKPPDYNA